MPVRKQRTKTIQTPNQGEKLRVHANAVLILGLLINQKRYQNLKVIIPM